MPEGHTVHRQAREHLARFGRAPVRLTSPQGRFAEGAAVLDGRVLERADAYGKHLFLGFEGRLWLHVHLGLYGVWAFGPAPAPPPQGALRVRLENESSYADLRGATACEVYTPADRRAVIARLGPDPLRRGADPHRPGLLVTRDEWDALWSDLVVLMRAGLRAGRIVTTRPGDRDRRSGPARPEDAHYVYRRTGLPCRVCGTPVATEVLVARNLFWCPRCQPT